jgi:hypothetical protein
MVLAHQNCINISNSTIKELGVNCFFYIPSLSVFTFLHTHRITKAHFFYLQLTIFFVIFKTAKKITNSFLIGYI